MKIIRISSELYPHVVGGVGLHVHDLSHDQAENGDNITICTCLADTDTGFISRENPATYNLGRRLVLFGNTFCFNLLPILWKTCKDYDVVHAHSHLYISTFLCAVVRRFRKFPLVITNHGLISQSVPSWFQNLYNKTVGRFIFSTADCIISYTKEEKEIISSFGVDTKHVRIIHNGIKVERFLTPLDVPNKKQLLWIGRYVSGKGARYLLEGFAGFSVNHPEYTLLMVGRGPEKDEMIQLAESLSISDKVLMVDFIPNDELQAVYQESEIFVSSSLAEGVPKTMLEAMVCGLPVISTDLPQLIDIVDDCGIIVPVKDSAAITSALEEMVSSPEKMQEYGKNSRQKVLENYDWRDTVLKTTELFEELSSSNSKK
ncbi:MAG: glycosyltransferase family 4 protein [Methanocorpusculum sp.]|nr:glycosyltransferase family 4 protein [Methanocorpusculum sp.]